MCDNAWAWAKERGLWRTNPVHKEEECKLVITDEFKYNVHQSHASEQSGTFEMQVGLCSIYATFSYKTPQPRCASSLPASFQPTSCQDPDGTLLQDDTVPEGMEKLVPNIDTPADAPTKDSTTCHSFKFLKFFGVFGHHRDFFWFFQDFNSEPLISKLNRTHQNPWKPRLVFPTLQQNTSVMSVIPQFLETLGRKIESAEREKDGVTRVKKLVLKSNLNKSYHSKKT